MIEAPWKLEELDPGEKLDRRVQRRMRAVAKSRAPARRAAPFLPFERAVYAVVVAVYAIYASACTVQVLHEARAAQVRSWSERWQCLLNDPRRITHGSLKPGQSQRSVVQGSTTLQA